MKTVRLQGEEKGTMVVYLKRVRLQWPGVFEMSFNGRRVSYATPKARR